MPAEGCTYHYEPGYVGGSGCCHCQQGCDHSLETATECTYYDPAPTASPTTAFDAVDDDALQTACDAKVQSYYGCLGITVDDADDDDDDDDDDDERRRRTQRSPSMVPIYSEMQLLWLPLFFFFYDNGGRAIT